MDRHVASLNGAEAEAEVAVAKVMPLPLLSALIPLIPLDPLTLRSPPPREETPDWVLFEPKDVARPAGCLILIEVSAAPTPSPLSNGVGDGVWRLLGGRPGAPSPPIRPNLPPAVARPPGPVFFTPSANPTFTPRPANGEATSSFNRITLLRWGYGVTRSRPARTPALSACTRARHSFSALRRRVLGEHEAGACAGDLAWVVPDAVPVPLEAGMGVEGGRMGKLGVPEDRGGAGRDGRCTGSNGAEGVVGVC